MKLKVLQCHPRARVPSYASSGAACVDIACVIDDERFTVQGKVPQVTISPGQKHVFRTGWKVEVPTNCVLKVYSRSGHGFKHGLRLANGTGIIDSDYRGELMVALHNDGAQPVTIGDGDRIAQGMLVQITPMRLEVVTVLSETERGEGGLGSTG